ncbi:hypothetical protein MYX82_13205 [Acidobacteria bacterium AH-259-D05]|nr:hypothetical protein [Acidobacteria bacterium AH-259-D05]
MVKRRLHFIQKISRIGLICLAGAGSAWLLLAGEVPSSDVFAVQQASLRAPTGYPQLVSYAPLPEMGSSEQCLLMPASASFFTAYALPQQSAPSRSSLPAETTSNDGDRPPRRVIHDTRPTFSAVAVDPVRGEVVVQDENLFQILVYDRLDHTPPQAAMTEPKRAIGGVKTKVEFNCGLYVDPRTGEIYSVSNDTVDTMVVFSRQAEGNVTPDRQLHTPHGTYGIAVDDEHQEIFLTVEHDSAVVVYRKTASEEEEPIRLLQGDRTRLADPHGIAVDSSRDLMFVANHGSVHRVSPNAGPARRQPKKNWPLNRNMAVPGSGQLLPPSISVYSRMASGNTAPIRVIEGPKTQLNWPASIAVEPGRGELFVANDGGHSILVFRQTDNGNVAPLRVLKGPETGLKNPTGISLDTQNNELWVSNFGNHSVTVYSLTAEGDTPSLRTIRAAPRGKVALGIGNPGGVAYDSKRKEILVPN